MLVSNCASWTTTRSDLRGWTPGSTSILVASAVASLFGSLVALNQWKNYRDAKRTNGIPGSCGSFYPLMDNTLQLLWKGRKGIQNDYETYGPIHRTCIFGNDYVRVSGNDAATFVLCNEHLFESRLSKHVEKLVEGFMLIQNGKEHRKNRNLMVRALSATQLQENIKAIADMFNLELTNWAKREGKVEDEGVDIYPAFKTALLKTMMKVLFGNSELSQEELMAFQKDYEAFGKISIGLPIDLPFTSYGQSLRARKRILIKLVKFIDDRRQICQASPGLVFNDLLQSMIDGIDPENGERTDTQSIAKNSLVVLLASIDTTCSLVASLMKLLHEYPDVRSKVVEECRQVFQSTEDLLNLSTKELSDRLTTLTYVDRVIQETLRFRPPVLGISRLARVDVEIPGTKFIIPKGWFVQIAMDFTFRADTEAFPESLKFDPDRFLLPNGSSANCAGFKGSFFPFGKGNHQCPGSKFSIAEAKMVITLIALKDRWPEVVGPSEGFELPKPSLELWNGLKLRFFE